MLLGSTCPEDEGKGLLGTRAGMGWLFSEQLARTFPAHRAPLPALLEPRAVCWAALRLPPFFAKEGQQALAHHGTPLFVFRKVSKSIFSLWLWGKTLWAWLSLV